MRTVTYNRLIGILTADIAKLEAKIEHDRFADWKKLTDEQNEKLKAISTAKSMGEQGKLLVEMEQLNKRVDKAWKVVEAGHRDMEKWFDEASALRSDLHSLKYSHSFRIQ